MVGCGAFLGFRSVEEHLNLHVSDFSYGVYPPDHEFAGLDFVRIDTLRGAKGKRDLSLNNCYYADTENNMRIPIFTSSTLDLYNGMTLEKCLGGAVTRLIKKVSDGQLRLYCYPFKGTQVMDGTRPLGKSKISTLHKEAAKELGMDMSMFLGGHAWRKLFCSVLANNPNVSLAEGMKAARHKSVSAHLAYVTADKETEAKRWGTFVSGTVAAATKPSKKEIPVDDDVKMSPTELKEQKLKKSVSGCEDEGICDVKNEKSFDYEDDGFEKIISDAIESGALFDTPNTKEQENENKNKQLNSSASACSGSEAQLRLSGSSGGSGRSTSAHGSGGTYRGSGGGARRGLEFMPDSRGVRDAVNDTSWVSVPNPYARKVSPECGEKEAFRRQIDEKDRRIGHLEKRLEESKAREARVEDRLMVMEDKFFQMDSDMMGQIATLKHEAENRESRLRTRIRALTHQVDTYRDNLTDMTEVYDFDRYANDLPNRGRGSH